MIIDTHAHIFPPKIASKAVENIGDFYHLPMRGGGIIDDMIAQGKSAGITHFIVNSSATVRKQVEQINYFIVESIMGKENVFGLATLHPDMIPADIDNAIAFAKANGLIGIKLHPDFQKFDIDDRNAYPMYERCENVLPILFHTGDSRYEYSAPSRLAKVAKDFPKLKCIGAHFGGYERWVETSCYKNLPNVYFDTSSSLFKLTKVQARQLIDTLGVDRFMFGVDYPMWDFTEELNRYYQLDLGDKINEKILYGNALDFYQIGNKLK